ncbi:MAG: AbrB/MazE/SpoVT family DNA-binding domain-containing protein [Gemmatimonadetes bacterium]|nr:AbrB/MazE/SpoVT family DNA-binding domain-containing protein [Gemmatimonadota bacterium]
MAKVTSKRQVTIPKAIADRYRIKEGDNLEFVAAGDVIRVVPPERQAEQRSIAERLELFDAATKRLQARQRHQARRRVTAKDRGWTRDQLYTRGRAG